LLRQGDVPGIAYEARKRLARRERDAVGDRKMLERPQQRLFRGTAGERHPDRSFAVHAVETLVADTPAPLA
jgi:hypothetical protein